ncbi:hypothetical protein LLG39_08855 [bacterium]|nr:hypothetical protein [bacterium]
MKKYSFVIPGTTGSVKHYIPIPDGGKVAGIRAVVNSTQTSGTAVVKVGKKGAANVLFTADLGTTGANGIGNVAKGVANASATDAEKAQMFDGSVPLELDIQLVVAGSVGITIEMDEFGVGGLRP